MSINKDKYESQPAKITKHVREFAKELGGQEPVVTKYMPQPWARHHRCYGNCEIAWRNGFGTPTFGWSMWNTKNLWLAAEYHCVLDMGDELVDITPTVLEESSVVFVPDGNILTEDNMEQVVERLTMKSISELGGYKQLVFHPLVTAALRLLSEASERHYRSGYTDVSGWNKSLDNVEQLLDKYFAQKARPSKRSVRATRKAERQRRKKARRCGG